MRISWAAAVLLVCSVAQADEQTNRMTPPGSDQVMVGIGIICNTSAQAEQFVGLRADGAETARAMSVVNQEAKDPRACGVATVAFMSDKTVTIKTIQGKLVSIVRINVVAAFDGRRWSPVPTLTQYALIEREGYEI